MLNYYLLTILWLFHLCSGLTSPVLWHLLRSTPWGHVQTAWLALGNLRSPVGLSPSLSVLGGCWLGWSTWDVSQALRAGAARLQRPHEPGAHVWLLRCQLALSKIFSTSCQAQLAQELVSEHSWTPSSLLWSNDAFYHWLQPAGSEALLWFAFNQGHFSPFLFQLCFAACFPFFLWVLKICNKKDLLVFSTLKIRGLLFPGSNFWTFSAWQCQ